MTERENPSNLEAKAIEDFWDVYEDKASFEPFIERDFSETNGFEIIGKMYLGVVVLGALCGAGLKGFEHGSGRSQGIPLTSLGFLPAVFSTAAIFKTIKNEIRVRKNFSLYQTSHDEKPYWDKIKELKGKIPQRIAVYAACGATTGTLIASVPYAIGYAAGLILR